DLPDPGAPQPPHGAEAPVPPVEVANDADAPRVGRPDSKADALHSVDLLQLRTQLLIEPPMPAFACEMQVHVAQRGEKAIWVAPLPDVSIRKGETIPIAQPRGDLRRRDLHLEHIGRVDPVHGNRCGGSLNHKLNTR